MNYSKKDMVSIIHEAAEIYDAELCHKNLLIIFGAPNAPDFIQTKATEKNFCHLTGVQLNLTGDNALDLFYAKAKDGNLSVNDFEINPDGTTQLKMLVIKQALNISKNAKMIGDFNNGRLKLKADKIAGSISSCIGFINQSGFFIPNTILNDDTRNNANINQRVLAILGKETSEKEYSRIKYVAKKIDINLLLKKLVKSVNIDKSLISDDEISQNNLVATSSKPTQMSITEDNVIPTNFTTQGDGIVALAPTMPPNDLFTQLTNNLLKGLANIAHKASIGIEKLNRAVTDTVNSLFAPKSHSEAHRASQSKNKGNSPKKKKAAENARSVVPVKRSVHEQEERTSVVGQIKELQAAQDKHTQAHQRTKSKSNDIEI